MWIESNRIYTHDSHAGPTVVFAGNGTSGGPPHYAPRQWHSIDLKPLGVSSDATFAMVSANMVITDLTPDIENLTATFRGVGSTFASGNYQMQQISVFHGDGQRGEQTVVVPLTDGCFEFYWDATVAGQPAPAGPSSFLINASLRMWGRNVAEQTVDEPTQPTGNPMVVQVPVEGLTLNLVHENSGSG